MIYIVIVNVIFIIWLYLKYIHIPKNLHSDYDELDELDSALIGYINDKDGNSIDWILSEILELNRKDYIEIEYIREDIDEYDYIMKKKPDVDITKLTGYELTAYRLLFDEVDEISMNELEEKIRYSLQKNKDTDVKSISIKNEIRDKLQELNIIDDRINSSLKSIRNVYIITTILLALITFKNTKVTIMIIFAIESILTLYTLSKCRDFTDKGKILYSKILNYKEKLKYNELLKEKKIIHSVILEKDYANSVALHIVTEAGEEFIKDELKENRNKRALMPIGNAVYTGFSGIIYIVFWILMLTLIEFLD